jgi:hypothetical protein
MNEALPSDLTLLWQNQDAEHPIPSETETRTKAEQLQAKARRNLVFAFVIGIVLLISCAISAVKLNYMIPRLIAAVMIIPISASIYKTSKRIWSPEAIEDEAASPCLEFYRKHVRDHHRAIILKWQLLVPTALLLWFAVTFMGRSFLILRVLFPAFLVSIFVLRHREIQKLRRDLAALDDFENEEERDR